MKLTPEGSAPPKGQPTSVSPGGITYNQYDYVMTT